MTPLSSFKAYHVICLAFFSLFAAGCSSSDNVKCPDCQDSQTLNSNVNLKITDKISDHDLFFGKYARYNLKQIKINHVVNGLLDTATVPLKIDSAKAFFNINVLYQHDADTLIMKIADLKPDTLFLSTGITTECCPHVYVSSATFNRALIYNTFDGTKTKLVKSNVITIPR
jgi:hypothetical protein